MINVYYDRPENLLAYKPWYHGTIVKQGPVEAAGLSVIVSGVQIVDALLTTVFDYCK